MLPARRFFYGTTLGNREAAAEIPLPRKADPLPTAVAAPRATTGATHSCVVRAHIADQFPN